MYADVWARRWRGGRAAPSVPEHHPAFWSTARQLPGRRDRPRCPGLVDPGAARPRSAYPNQQAAAAASVTIVTISTRWTPASRQGSPGVSSFMESGKNATSGGSVQTAPPATCAGTRSHQPPRRTAAASTTPAIRPDVDRCPLISARIARDAAVAAAVTRAMASSAPATRLFKLSSPSLQVLLPVPDDRLALCLRVVDGRRQGDVAAVR